MKLYHNYLSPEEEQSWKELGGATLQDAWVKKMEGKGFKMYKQFLMMLKNL